jgi:hypothetical protein
MIVPGSVQRLYILSAFVNNKTPDNLRKVYLGGNYYKSIRNTK